MRYTVLNFLIIFALALPAGLLSAQKAPSAAAAYPSGSKLKWGTLESTRQTGSARAKTLLSIYADWCGWCKKMEAETYSNPKIADYLQDNFNLIQLNAGQSGEVVFNGKTYGVVKVGQKSYNELAYTLLNGRMEFPALVFLNESLQVIQVIPGYKSAEDLMPILVYFGSNEYRIKPWPAFLKQFKPN